MLSRSKTSSEASCGPLGARSGGFYKFYPGKLVSQELLGGLLWPGLGGFCKFYPGKLVLQELLGLMCLDYVAYDRLTLRCV